MSENTEKTVLFMQALHDAALDGLKRSTEHIALLRRENQALKEQLASIPSTLSELQDRVTMLEQMLRPTHFDKRMHELRTNQ